MTGQVSQATSVVIYLHGFGCIEPLECPVAVLLSRILSKQEHHRTTTSTFLYVPCYHPQGDISQTNFFTTLASLRDWITNNVVAPTNKRRKLVLVGYSVGGYLAALLAEQHPEIVLSGLILLAPAIDNYQRNFEKKTTWYMPATYVLALRDEFPSRPQVNAAAIRTVIVHGLRDTDHGGSAPWRIREYAKALGKCVTLYEPDMDHSLEPWLSRDEPSADGTAPSLETLVLSMLIN